MRVCVYICVFVFFRDAFGGACLRPGHCLPLGRPGGMPGGGGVVVAVAVVVVCVGAWWCVVVRRWCGGGVAVVVVWLPLFLFFMGIGL